MARIIDAALARAGGWLPFDQFMALALYAPGAGYYAHGSRKFGHMPASGSDFVTAPELTPLFGQTLAEQVREALAETGTQEVWEFGAGSGALAAQLLENLGDAVQRYTIVDLSGSLRARQQEALAAWGDRVRWVDQLPERFEGVVVGNEVLDAMPVKLLVRKERRWHERGVYRTRDGGRNWQKVLFRNEHAGAIDIVLDPGNPKVLYASTLEMRRYPWGFRSAGPVEDVSQLGVVLCCNTVDDICQLLA